MLFHAPTISEAILDVLIREPNEWLYESMHAKIQDNFVVPGCSGGINEDMFYSAIKSLKKRHMIKTRSEQGNSYLFLRKTFDISSHESQVTLLNDSSSNLQLHEALTEKREQKFRSQQFSSKVKHYVYYVQWENDLNHVKVGYSSRPEQRFVSFLTANPHRLFVLRVEEVDSPLAEVSIHKKFNHLRINREWFSYTGSLKKYINSLSCETNIKIDQHISDCHKSNIFVYYF